MNKILEVIF